jgi:hypothetical protein
MKLFKKRDKDNSDTCPHGLEYGICEICPILGGWDPEKIVKTEPVKKVVSPNLIKMLEVFKADMSKIHDGDSPDWNNFFKTAKKLEKEWWDLNSEYGECAQFSSEVMDSGDLASVEWLFKDKDFINGVIELITVDNHFACWLLTSEHTEFLSAEVLSDIYQSLATSAEGGYCDECIYGIWWDQPITYLAAHVNTDSNTLEQIFKKSEGNLEVLCAIAQNKNTPAGVLSKLIEIDDSASYQDEELCPFFEPEDSNCFNISYRAHQTLKLING